MKDVAIRYTRLPDRTTVFRQKFVERVADCTVTLMNRTPLDQPIRAGDDIILEPDAPVVWFTFDRAWHDIGRFHLADGRFTGWYANVLTPVRRLSPHEWETTDLFLDVWVDTTGAVSILDEDELAAAVADGVVDGALADTARREASRIASLAETAQWPPPVTREWTLEHARDRLERVP